ncbi:MAG: hypothetical protein OXG24_03500 [Gammaproteobacteria bacterium]|nr:hypothetical protein [Gammaproteobacteria bacterium]
MGKLSEAIDRLVPNEPLFLNDGSVVTDDGILVLSFYVDVGMEKLRQRPTVLVKYSERGYALEHACTVQLQSLSGLREPGERFIQDPKEGRVQQEAAIEKYPQYAETLNREIETAMLNLGINVETTSTTESLNTRKITQRLTFGKNSWIYCTSIATTLADRIPQRAMMDPKYDYDSTANQVRSFTWRNVCQSIGPKTKNIVTHKSRWN